MKTFWLIFLCAPLALAGTPRYVAPSGGASSGAGGIGSPWTHQWAVSTSNTTRAAGDTMYYRAGRYMIDAGDGGSSLNRFAASGTASLPLIYRNYPGERVTLYSNVQSVSMDVGPWCPVHITGDHVWIWGMEISNESLPKTGTDSVFLSSNILVAGDSCKIINCITHDACSIAITDQQVTGTEVVGCIIYHNGRQIGYDNNGGYPGYVQNTPTYAKKTWRENIWWGGYGLGTCFYGAAGLPQNINIIGNVMFNVGNEKGHEANQTGAEKFMYNMVIGTIDNDGGAKAANDTILYNYSWFDASPASNQGVDIGYNGDPATGMRVDSNVFVAGDMGAHFNVGAGFSFDGNIVVGSVDAGIKAAYPEGVNNYYTTRSTGRADDKYVRVNPYEPNRANVTIINWDGSPTVTFDPSSVLTSGDPYVVIPATNPFDTIATGTWTSGNITLTCSDFSMAAPFRTGMTHGQVTLYDARNPQPYFLSAVLIGGGTGGVVEEPTTAPVVTGGLVAGNTSVSGTSESGATITVYIDAVPAGTVVASGTSWTKTVTALVAGNQVYATALASGKTVSPPSNVVTVANTPVSSGRQFFPARR
jgi:hypothetical protein